MVGYKVLLTTSGLGSRLGNLSKFTNKSLVRVGDKAVISLFDLEFIFLLKFSPEFLVDFLYSAKLSYLMLGLFMDYHSSLFLQL